MFEGITMGENGALKYGSYKVLVVDDDERLLALAQLALSKNGMEVETANTSGDALEIFGNLQPDLVILDIVMPDLSGWEVLRRIRESSDVTVMLLSGRDSDVDKARGLDLGADDYLTKPFSFLEFEARVRALLRRSRPEAPEGF
jgi:two-component system, OmpR family, response regulator MtrA